MDRKYQGGFGDLRQQRTLGEYPGEMVNLACRACARQGRYRKASLVARYGAGEGLVNILNHLSAACQAERTDPWGNNTCRAYFAELAAEAAQFLATKFPPRGP